MIVIIYCVQVTYVTKVTARWNLMNHQMANKNKGDKRVTTGILDSKDRSKDRCKGWGGAESTDTPGGKHDTRHLNIIHNFLIAYVNT